MNELGELGVLQDLAIDHRAAPVLLQSPAVKLVWGPPDDEIKSAVLDCHHDPFVGMRQEATRKALKGAN